MSKNVRFYVSHDVKITSQSHFGVKTYDFAMFYIKMDVIT